MNWKLDNNKNDNNNDFVCDGTHITHKCNCLFVIILVNMLVLYKCN